MTSYTEADVKQAVDYFTPGGEHTWDMFLSLLRQGPVQLPVRVGKAELVEEFSYDDAGDYDSYGSSTVVKGFVFSVTNAWWVPNVRHFRVSVDDNSFGGVHYSDFDEVKHIEIKQLKWETV